MEIAAAESLPEDQLSCWCCGTAFEDSELTRLGAHPEVGICAGCAHWLHRRARLGADHDRRAPTAILRRGVHRARDAVIRLGASDWPVLSASRSGSSPRTRIADPASEVVAAAVFIDIQQSWRG